MENPAQTCRTTRHAEPTRATMRCTGYFAIAAYIALFFSADAALPADFSSHQAASSDITPSEISPVNVLRRKAWSMVAHIVQPSHGDGAPDFSSWPRANVIFANNEQSKASLHAGAMDQSPEPEIIIFTFYNETAARHIREHRLHLRGALDRFLAAGEIHPRLTHNRTIPPLPADSVVVLTAWWPIARSERTPLPVWDPDHNPSRRHGNNYLSWPRIVAVDHAPQDDAGVTPIAFVGREFADANRVSLNDFHHVEVDERMAAQLIQDDRTRKASIIALGRGIEPGDALALVAMHVAAKNEDVWQWATLWWHDHADHGEFANDRPALPGPWNNYLMDVALDTSASDEPDICFNPWLEARFSDQGAGGGTVSNCIACHQRASYPSVSFLPVTRGPPDLLDDPAYSPDRLRTDFLWSIPRQAR